MLGDWHVILEVPSRAPARVITEERGQQRVVKQAQLRTPG